MVHTVRYFCSRWKRLVSLDAFILWFAHFKNYVSLFTELQFRVPQYLHVHHELCGVWGLTLGFLKFMTISLVFDTMRSRKRSSHISWIQAGQSPTPPKRKRSDCVLWLTIWQDSCVLQRICRIKSSGERGRQEEVRPFTKPCSRVHLLESSIIAFC